jgi:hypothetical protein
MNSLSLVSVLWGYRQAKAKGVSGNDAFKSIILGNSIGATNVATSMVVTDALVKREARRLPVSKVTEALVEKGESKGESKEYVTRDEFTTEMGKIDTTIKEINTTLAEIKSDVERLKPPSSSRPRPK